MKNPLHQKYQFKFLLYQTQLLTLELIGIFNQVYDTFVLSISFTNSLSFIEYNLKSLIISEIEFLLRLHPFHEILYS